ncbi:2-hydroxychromene-2-carboxylate isomerase [Arenimonas terrae]|uniref:2-hydroxychromene-2-carboxylate isomerase n=1 Tax=Arenimonas terrae TaxID=2546226 RepID=A0A5C4RYK6_9GAMM|nr:2-hydroxychromene-2-carboxylate isomerase [Arenimonas terrae]TNJ35731.1 2-hydroxychromene-2-carboxylate isomerase [Arenimonas terrae]
MATIHWYFDFISPFAYLQWPRVRELATRHPVELRPVLFAGVLDHIGQKGPAEIPAKRVFTYRHVLWRARQRGLPMRFPPAHPFNPLAALRLCVALDARPDATGAIFDWIWAQGRAGDSVEALAPLARTLGVADIAAAVAAPAVKQQLKANFEAALAAQVFGVPTLVIDGDLFWGDDAFDFALARLADPTLLDDDEMRRVSTLPVAAQRI